jgi:hypothetical protein
VILINLNQLFKQTNQPTNQLKKMITISKSTFEFTLNQEQKEIVLSEGFTRDGECYVFRGNVYLYEAGNMLSRGYVPTSRKQELENEKVPTVHEQAPAEVQAIAERSQLEVVDWIEVGESNERAMGNQWKNSYDVFYELITWGGHVYCARGTFLD